ncbi:MAG: Cna B-type domain-containing protein [Lachnospiraceae bacterium]
MYDAKGCKYIYFVRECFTNGAGDYVQIIDNTQLTDEDYASYAQAAGNSYVLNGGTITNRREAQISISATKTFVAQAMHSFDNEQNSVTLRLQRSLDGVAWEDVQGDDGTTLELTMTGFREEAMSQTQSFGESVPKYDATGNLYTYRYVEVGLTVEGSQNAEDALNPGNGESTDGEIIVLGEVGLDQTTAKFVTTTQEDGSIQNTLVGSTQVHVVKSWSYTNAAGEVSTEAPEGAVVTATLQQNGSAQGIVDNAGNTVTEITLSEQSGWTGDFTNLPRYDAQGREYEYTVVESNADLYGYSSHVTYDKTVVTDTNGEVITQLNTSIVNSKTEGTELTFDVKKVWLDDGDLLLRSQVTVGLYDRRTGAKKAETVLNSSNLWSARITFSPENPTDTVQDYVLRETAIQSTGAVVSYAWDAADLSDADARLHATYAKIKNGTAEIAGSAETASQLYNVYIDHTNSEDLISASYTVTNQRVGVLRHTLTKTWKGGGDAPASEFRLTRTVGGKQDTSWTLDFTLEAEESDSVVKTASWQSEELPKYNSLGELYSYQLSERTIGGSEIQDGQAVVDDETYSSSISLKSVDYNAQNTNDLYTWSAVNQKVGSDRLTVNKVWRDDGTAKNTTARPDITFNLYSTTAKTAEEVLSLTSAQLKTFISDTTSVKKETCETLWNTRHNDWYWSCDLGTFPRYDSDGTKIVYFLLENMRGNVNDVYQTVYYNGTEQPTAAIGSSGTTKEAFDPSDYEEKISSSVMIVSDGTQTYSSEDARTTVNTRTGTKEVKGEKIWLNLPSSFSTSNLPTITLTLYRNISLEDVFTTPMLDQNGSPVQTTLAKGATTYVFGSGSTLPTYDEYGRLYYYRVKESPVDGYNMGEKLGNCFVLRNTYLKNSASNRVEITITKNWQLPGVYDSFPLADVTFILKQQMVDASGNVIAGSTQEVNRKVLEVDNHDEATLTFTKDSAKLTCPTMHPTGTRTSILCRRLSPMAIQAQQEATLWNPHRKAAAEC